MTDAANGEVDVIDESSSPFSSSPPGWSVESKPIYLNGSGPSATLAPTSIAFTPAGDMAYVADGGSGAITSIAEGFPYRFNSMQPALGPGGNGFAHPVAIGVAPDGRHVYIADDGSSGTLYVATIASNGSLIAPSQSQQTTIPLHPTGLAISPEGRDVFVSSAGSVSKIDSSTLQVSTQSLGTTSTAGVVDDPDGVFDIVAGVSSGSGSAFIEGGPTAHQVTVGSSPSAIAVSPDYAAPFNESLIEPSGMLGGGNPSIAASGAGLHDVIDGMDPATGSYSLSLSLFNLPSPGAPLALTQTWDSNNTASGPMGNGWTTSYNQTVTGPKLATPYAGGPQVCQVTWNQENGSTVVFSAQPVNGNCPVTLPYAPPSQAQAHLFWDVCNYNGNPNTSCWRTERDGMTHWFFAQVNGSSSYKLIAIGDAAHNTVATVEYNSAGNISSIQGANLASTSSNPVQGRELDFSYDSNSRVQKIAVKQIFGNEVDLACAEYSYGAAGNLTQLEFESDCEQTDSSNDFYKFSWTGKQLTSWWDPANSGSSPDTTEATNIGYTAGLVTSVTAPKATETPSGRVVQPQWTVQYGSWQPWNGTGTVIISDPNQNDPSSPNPGNVTLDKYVTGSLVAQISGYGTSEAETTVAITLRDPATALPVNVEGPDGEHTLTEYDALGNPATVTDPMGNSTHYEYNGMSEVVNTLDAMGYDSSATYDGYGFIQTKTDANGNTTRYTYTTPNYGQPATVMTPGVYVGGTVTQQATSFSYDNFGDVTMIDAPGSSGDDVKTMLYQASTGRLCEAMTPNGYAAGQRLPNGCPTSQPVSPSYNTTITLGWDFYGNVLETIAPASDADKTAPSGSCDGASYSGESVWCYTFDADGRSLTKTSPEGNTSSTLYDALGRVDEQISPPTVAGGTVLPTTSFTYDASGQVIATVPPDGNTGP
ncbi:MAG TPA: DUF6531 domain-containing protein, partial [Acidimicrobiales bacterium]|nr:DUF6531 domain-containing protein [Acidimicrobiales bacterium]